MLRFCCTDLLIIWLRRRRCRSLLAKRVSKPGDLPNRSQQIPTDANRSWPWWSFSTVHPSKSCNGFGMKMIPGKQWGHSQYKSLQQVISLSTTCFPVSQDGLVEARWIFRAVRCRLFFFASSSSPNFAQLASGLDPGVAISWQKLRKAQSRSIFCGLSEL